MHFRVSFGACAAAAVLLACSSWTPPRGGWDIGALLAAEPEWAAKGGAVLGDLVPFPLLRSDAVDLIVCRFAPDRPIPVSLAVAPERIPWALDALLSIERGLPSVVFEILDPQPANSAPFMGLTIADYDGAPDAGPAGVGDTRVLCRGGARPGSQAGTIERGEIRMRAARRDALDRTIPVDAEAWTGALMHEVGHALGFQGHVAGGSSVMVLGQSRLRAAGRRALSGEPWEDVALASLYRLAPGRRLESRPLSLTTRNWIGRIREQIAKTQATDRLESSPPLLFTMVGDRSAQWVWGEDGDSIRLVFPYWRDQLAEGSTLIGIPNTSSRRRLESGAEGKAPVSRP